MRKAARLRFLTPENQIGPVGGYLPVPPVRIRFMQPQIPLFYAVDLGRADVAGDRRSRPGLFSSHAAARDPGATWAREPPSPGVGTGRHRPVVS